MFWRSRFQRMIKKICVIWRWFADSRRSTGKVMLSLKGQLSAFIIKMAKQINWSTSPTQCSSIHGFDSSKLQDNTCSFKFWSEIDKHPHRFVVSAEEAGGAVAGLELTDKNQKWNILSEKPLEKEGDDLQSSWRWNDRNACLDRWRCGSDWYNQGSRQTITVHYKGVSTSFDVLVNPKTTSTMNTQAKLAEAEAAKVDFTFATLKSKKPC